MRRKIGEWEEHIQFRTGNIMYFAKSDGTLHNENLEKLLGFEKAERKTKDIDRRGSRNKVKG